MFEFLGGRLDSSAAEAVQEHLTHCVECTLLVESLRRMKSLVSMQSSIAVSHPPVGDLASFFYESRAQSASVAAHVAQCPDCAEELSNYARAEAAVLRSNKAAAPSAAQVPANAWEMIKDWEDSVFAKPKEDVAASDLLEKLSALRDSLVERPGDWKTEAEGPGQIEVAVIDRSGKVQAIELFDEISGGFKHADESRRYDEKLVHALFEFGQGQSYVVSDRVRGDRIELTQEMPSRTRPLSASYFIVDD